MKQRPAETYIRACRLRSESDWKHAPLHFKLYRDCVRIPLSAASVAALSLVQDEQPACSLGLLLHDIYGVIRTVVFQMADQQVPDEKTVASTYPTYLLLSRTVPSGGACFPCELYLLVNSGQDLAAGLYHYDAAHHILDLLKVGDFTPTLLHALAQPPEKQPSYTLVLSSLFWKDAFKYQEFSYRLQSLDIGCLLAQAQIVTEQYDLCPTLHFRFLDYQINQILGLNQLKESVYAVITLENSSKIAGDHVLQHEPKAFASSELPATLEQYKSLSRWPLLEAIHHASCIETSEYLHAMPLLPLLPLPEPTSDLTIALPQVVYTHLRANAVRRRSAQLSEFRPRALTLPQLALLLQTSQRGYRGDLDNQVSSLSHTLLYCVINHVEDVPPGVYCYQPKHHLLRQVCPGEFQQIFQATLDPGLSAANLSLCIIPVGNYAMGFQTCGDRWYRMQNMEAGMIVQRLYLAAALSGLGCRANLSYREQRLDTLLSLPTDYTGLIQVLISPLALDTQASNLYEQSIRW